MRQLAAEKYWRWRCDIWLQGSTGAGDATSGCRKVLGLEMRQLTAEKY
jgi:hypothetical protein